MTEAAVQHLDDSSFEQATSEGVTLVDFWAPWCAPCRMIGPIVEELAGVYDGRVTMAKVNVDDCPRTAAKFHIQAIPLLVLMKDGREVDRAVGLQPAGSLRAMIDRAL